MLRPSLGLLFIIACVPLCLAAEPEFPTFDQLKPHAELPDPLTTLAGKKVTSVEQWERERKPELKALFEHYMYGRRPAAPDKIEFIVEHTKKDFLGGKATKKEVTIRFSPDGSPDLQLLVVVPNDRKAGAPVFVGPNFNGNHLVWDDPTIRLPTTWMPDGPGVVNHKATDAARGKQATVWNVDLLVDRGYALATFYCGDLDPDNPDLSNGLHPNYLKPGTKELGPTDPSSITLWAWGVSRAVDYLAQDQDIDAKRIAVVGHSRLGKTALLAGAFDERIAVVIPSQAGCGGTAPSRGKVGESVKQINDRFPHWFCGNFKKFNDEPERLPFDQNCLLAICAPRPILIPNAEEDQWANPDGQFQALLAAEPVYKLYGVEGCAVRERPSPGKLVDSRLGYFYRTGKHSMSREDWEAFIAFADKNMPAK